MDTAPEPDRQTLAAAIALDEAGMLVGPEESAARFFERAERVRQAQKLLQQELHAGPVRPAAGIVLHRQDCIPETVLAEARAVTEPLYGFSAGAIPGFFANERWGGLWGGCTLSDPESGLNLFLIRKAFRNRRRWWIYERSELLAHELCHAARQGFNDPELEEFYAYRTSRSGLRRYLGNCFAGRFDALVFLLPALLLPFVQMLNLWFAAAVPLAPFWWLCAMVWDGFLVRNHWRQSRWRSARKALQRCGVTRPDAVLFRSTYPELPALARLQTPEEWRSWLKQKEAELRWRIIAVRFGASEPRNKEQ